MSAYRPTFVLLVLSFIQTAHADVSVTVSPPSPQPVGTRVTLSISGDMAEPFDIRVSEVSGLSPGRVLYDFGTRRDFEWARLDEGPHALIVELRNLTTGQTELLDTVRYDLTSIAVDQPVIVPTLHPLVALYALPACAPGRHARVRFRTSGALQAQRTSTKPCRLGRSVNFHVAGMRASTSYAMRHELLRADGQVVAVSAEQDFTAGLSEVDVTSSVLNPPDSNTARAQPIVLHMMTGGQAFPFATDLDGELVWYLDKTRFPSGRFVGNRLLDGGRLLLRAPTEDLVENTALWELDLAGNLMRETTVARISEQLQALGEDPVTEFHHEARLLSDGRLAVLAHVERILTDVQGEGDVDVLGDMIAVLDQNLQVVWSWNAFDHLDASRKAVLGEVCTDSAPGCPRLELGIVANDWLHSNAIDESPDGNLIVSVRHQDWVIKIDYQGGAGDGSVLWRLGQDGDFELLVDGAPTDVFPWHNHAHDPNYIATNAILLYDNANTRCALFDVCESRGQIYLIDEGSMQARLAESINLGVFSGALGSAQLLGNGNLHFGSGLVQPAPDPLGIAHEFLRGGPVSYAQSTNVATYRSFRLRDLYTAP